MAYFVVKCKKLDSERDRRIKEDPDMPAQEKTVEILFKSENYQETALMIINMGNQRKRMKDDLRPP